MKIAICRNSMIFLLITGVLCSSAVSLADSKKSLDGKDARARGEYLVVTSGCHDCHSPKIFSNKGPTPDPARLLSGFPAEQKLADMPASAIGPDKWGGVFTNDLTGWVGPWGASFASNLTPDKETGIGSWTEDLFVQTIRNGKHFGTGRDLLPPMPWQDYRNFTDGDLKAIFTYLLTLKPIRNKVPAPVPPSGAGN